MRSIYGVVIRISTPLVALVPHLHQQLQKKSEVPLKWVMVVGVDGTGGGAAARTVYQYGVNTTDAVYYVWIRSRDGLYPSLSVLVCIRGVRSNTLYSAAEEAVQSKRT